MSLMFGLWRVTTHACQEVNKEKKKFQHTYSFVWYPVNSQNEVIFEEDVAHNREEVDEDKGQHGSQNNRSSIASDAFYDIQQSLFPVNQIKELE